MIGFVPNGCGRRRGGAALVALAMLVPAMATASADLCRHAAAQAARETGVPLPVLMAVSLTETGRGRDGDIAPWPWALNMGGQGVWAENRADALRRAEAARAAGRRNFDLGCFQINYRWHGENFASLDEMLDPGRNALYAARFLARLHGELGDWSAAAGRYHSATAVHADRYRQVFESHLAALGGPGAPVLAAVATPRENNFPLLSGVGTPGRMGSLVPRAGGGGTLLGGATRPFWGGS